MPPLLRLKSFKAKHGGIHLQSHCLAGSEAQDQLGLDETVKRNLLMVLHYTFIKPREILNVSRPFFSVSSSPHTLTAQSMTLCFGGVSSGQLPYVTTHDRIRTGLKGMCENVEKALGKGTPSRVGHHS